MAQLVERVLGKDEVGGSNPPSSSKKPLIFKGFFIVKKRLAHGLCANSHFQEKCNMAKICVSFFFICPHLKIFAVINKA